MSRPVFPIAIAIVLAACHHSPRGPGGGDGPLNDAGVNGVLSLLPPSGALTVTNPATPVTLQLTAELDSGNGPKPVSATFSVDRFDIAGIDPNAGLLTTSGAAFGVVTVTAAFGGLTATAPITVTLKEVLNPGNATTTQMSSLDGASAGDGLIAGLLYPYDKTVFPRALLAPELQWKGGADADLYRVHFSAASYDVTIYTSAANPSRYTLPQPLWDALGASAAPGAVSVDLRRLDAVTNQAYASAAQTWTVADANLRGTIYYWAISQGQIVALDVSSGTLSTAFDSGPAASLGTPVPVNSGAPASPPWEDNGTGKRCVACHAVSKDGSTLAAVFTRASSTGPIGVVNLATTTPVDVGDYTASVIYTALAPDGKLAVANNSNMTMSLIDTTTGLVVASALDALTNICDPSFSPDGKTFALATSCTGSYPVEYTSANLTLYDFDETSRAFTNARTVQTSTGSGDAIAFPSFSPDAKQVFYQRGSYSRAKYGANQHGVDDLYVSTAVANGAQVALDNANGKGVLSADSAHLNYAPTVNPVSAGGYTWVVFTSPRDYGNRMESPQGAAPMDASYANRKQLWVTAVDATTGTTDPSHPAFWLPGQDLATINMFGYWALSPCKPTSGSGDASSSNCSAGFECCSGFCRNEPGMFGMVCVAPPAGCSQNGEKCTMASDCCNGAPCVAGICQAGIQ